MGRANPADGGSGGPAGGDGRSGRAVFGVVRKLIAGEVRVCSGASAGDHLSDGEFPAWRMAAPDREHVVSVAGRFCSRRRLGAPVGYGVCLVAGAAALQFYAWTNPASIIPCVGASGAVAALMGAFLVRFPKMKIQMLWILGFFRTYRFQAAAYWLLPLWALTEVFYGSLFGKMSGVAHWAHVGGFAFGALGATALRYTGFENRVHEKVEKKLTWSCDPEIECANQHVEQGKFDEAVALLQQHVAVKPNSMDAWNQLAADPLAQKRTAAISRGDGEDLRASLEGKESRCSVAGL